MRWFVVLLLVANIILFFWVKQQSRVATSDPIAPPDIGHLELTGDKPVALSEDEGSDDAVAPERVSASRSLPGEVASESLTELGSSSTPEVLAAEADPVDEVREETANKPQPAPPPLSASAETLEARRDAAETRAAPPVGEDTAAQAATDGRQQPGREGALAESGVIGSTAPARCYRLGPLSAKAADGLIARLPASVSLVSDGVEKSSDIEGYYVLIPPLPSRAEGRRVVDQLAAAGVKDTWLLSTGPWRNGVSLGYFSRESGARKRAADIAAKGFSTRVEAKTASIERRRIVLKSSRDPRAVLSLDAGVPIQPQECR